MRGFTWVLLWAWLAMGACSDQSPAPASDEVSDEAPEAPEEPAEQPAEDEPRRPGPIDDSWVEARVSESRERLQASEGGRIVWQAMEAHGGLANWLVKGTMEFEFDYRPRGNPERRMHTRQKVDHWSARAVHHELVDLEQTEGTHARDIATLGWNGEVAWILPTEASFPTTARFWSLTPYYFVAMPFVVGDPGTNFELLEASALDGRTQDVVRVTFGDGIGDSPDDYYILHIDSETHRLHALRYIVAYPGFFPEGGHSPEKIMRYELVEVDGLLFPQTLNTSQWSDDTGPGDVVTDIDVRDIRLGQTYASDVFDPMSGAVVLDGIQQGR